MSHANEDLLHYHLLIKQDKRCATFEAGPLFQESNPDRNVNAAKVGDIYDYIIDRFGDIKEIRDGHFYLTWNGQIIDPDMNIADVEVDGKKIGLYNHETVPFIAVVNSCSSADFKALNDADNAERETRGGKKKTRSRRIITLRNTDAFRKQMYSAHGIITLRKKGAKGRKGRRKIERSTTFRNKR
jgi:hypothetical protein